MLNIVGLVAAFIDLWMISGLFSSTAEPEARATLYVIVPLWTLATAACFYFANRQNKTIQHK